MFCTTEHFCCQADSGKRHYRGNYYGNTKQMYLHRLHLPSTENSPRPNTPGEGRLDNYPDRQAETYPKPLYMIRTYLRKSLRDRFQCFSQNVLFQNHTFLSSFLAPCDPPERIPFFPVCYFLPGVSRSSLDKFISPSRGEAQASEIFPYAIWRNLPIKQLAKLKYLWRLGKLGFF